MSVLISTAYMDEAQRWDWIVAMDAGRVLATGTPCELMERTGTRDLEEAFVALLPPEKRGDRQARRFRPAGDWRRTGETATHLTGRFPQLQVVSYAT